ADAVASWTSGYALAYRVDTLIHDAQYAEDEYPSRRGFGHSSLAHAVAFAQTAEAGKLVLFHHDPLHSDSELEQLEQRACELWERSDLAPTLARDRTRLSAPRRRRRSASSPVRDHSRPSCQGGDS